MSVARFGELLVSQSLGEVALGDEVYVGLYVCSHNNGVSEGAVFRNVRLVRPAPGGFVPYRDYIGSDLELLDVATGRRKVVDHADGFGAGAELDARRPARLCSIATAGCIVLTSRSAGPS